MLKAQIDLRKNDIKIEQCLSDVKDIADTISIILERIIIDTYIKSSPREMALPLEEQKAIIITKKYDILSMINEHNFDLEYINSAEISDIFEQKEFIENLNSTIVSD